VLNAVAWLISARRSDHTSPFLCELYALAACSGESDSGCVVAFRCLHGTAPWYLAGSLRRAADVDGRRHHRSANAVLLVVPSTRRTTLGDRAFPAAAPRAWNDLPPTIRASPSLLTFQQLKHSFFNLHFTDSIMTDFSELLKISLLDDTKKQQ